jgi:hypothetical protein
MSILVWGRNRTGLANVVNACPRKIGKTDRVSNRIMEHAVPTWGLDAAAATCRAVCALSLSHEVVNDLHPPAGTEVA